MAEYRREQFEMRREFEQEQGQMRRDFNHMIGIIVQQQSEIAGLRTETNRMLGIFLTNVG
jgi:hypothetical protein